MVPQHKISDGNCPWCSGCGASGALHRGVTVDGPSAQNLRWVSELHAHGWRLSERLNPFRGCNQADCRQRRRCTEVSGAFSRRLQALPMPHAQVATHPADRSAGDISSPAIKLPTADVVNPFAPRSRCSSLLAPGAATRRSDTTLLAQRLCLGLQLFPECRRPRRFGLLPRRRGVVTTCTACTSCRPWWPNTAERVLHCLG